MTISHGCHTLVYGFLLSALFATRVEGVCYLEDANADCEVCWKTEYASTGDKLGVTTVAECPTGIVQRWEQGLPERMVEMFEYKVQFSIQIDKKLFPVLENDDGLHVPHANIHSCITSRGACTPFVRIHLCCPRMLTEFRDWMSAGVPFVV